jgi:hypothetical protein
VNRDYYLSTKTNLIGGDMSWKCATLLTFGALIFPTLTYSECNSIQVPVVSYTIVCPVSPVTTSGFEQCMENSCDSAEKSIDATCKSLEGAECTAVDPGTGKEFSGICKHNGSASRCSYSPGKVIDYGTLREVNVTESLRCDYACAIDDNIFIVVVPSPTPTGVAVVSASSPTPSVASSWMATPISSIAATAGKYSNY